MLWAPLELMCARAITASERKHILFKYLVKKCLQKRRSIGEGKDSQANKTILKRHYHFEVFCFVLFLFFICMYTHSSLQTLSVWPWRPKNGNGFPEVRGGCELTQLGARNKTVVLFQEAVCALGH